MVKNTSFPFGAQILSRNTRFRRIKGWVLDGLVFVLRKDIAESGNCLEGEEFHLVNYFIRKNLFL